MKKLLLFFGAMLFGVLSFAQQMLPATVSNGGGNMNISNLKAGFTLGQPVTGQISNASVTFTQGFQQNWLIEPDAIDEWGKPGIQVSVSPNPSPGIFNIRRTTQSGFQTLTGFAWEVINIHGSAIASGNSKTNDFTIDLSSHPKGIYYLKITQGELQTVRKLVLQ